MYRVKVMDYNHNITPGSRYCFTQKTALRLVKLFLECGAKAEEDFTVEKFYRISPGVFAWSSVEENNLKFRVKYLALIVASEKAKELAQKRNNIFVQSTNCNFS